LGIRLADGVSAETLDRDRAEILVSRGLFDAGAWAHGRAVLTLQGRLLADAVVRDLT